MKKRTLSILLIVAMIASICVTPALAVLNDATDESLALSNGSAVGTIHGVLSTESDAAPDAYYVFVVPAATSTALTDFLETEPNTVTGMTTALKKCDNWEAAQTAIDALGALSKVSGEVFAAKCEPTKAAAAEFDLTLATTGTVSYYVIAVNEGQNVFVQKLDLEDGKLPVTKSTITWDYQGKGTNSTSTNVPEGEKIGTRLPALTDTDTYHFTGWFTAAGDEVTADTTMGNTDVTYYARGADKTVSTDPTVANNVKYFNGIKLSAVGLTPTNATWTWDNGNTVLDSLNSNQPASVAKNVTYTTVTSKNLAVALTPGEVELNETSATVKINTKLADIDPADLFSVIDKNATDYTLEGVTIEWADDVDTDTTVTEAGQKFNVKIGLTAAQKALYTDLTTAEVTITGAERTDTTWKVAPKAPAKAVEGETAKLAAEANSGGTITYTSSDPDVVAVANDGTMTFKKVGKATITVTAAQTDEFNELKTTVEINVVPAVTAEPHDAFMFGYEKTKNFGPDDSLTRAQAVTILARLDGWKDGEKVEVDEMYSDVKQVWYYNAICYAKEKGIVKGYEDGTFQPDKEITRAEFATMLARMSNGSDPEGLDSKLSDAKAHWANASIAYIETKFPGSITGREDGLFHPNDDITRAETAKIVNGYLGRLQSVSAKEADQLSADLNKFDDVKRCTWYYNNVIEATVDHDSIDTDFHTGG